MRSWPLPVELQAIYTEEADELNEVSNFGVSLFFAD
jgi:hypothetical protein